MSVTSPRSDLTGDARGIVELLKAYVQQETIDPLKGVARYLAYGMAGSALMSIGLMMVALSSLRALQTETGTTFTGNWSWVPYLITLLGTLAVAALAASRISKGAARKEAAR